MRRLDMTRQMDSEPNPQYDARANVTMSKIRNLVRVGQSNGGKGKQRSAHSMSASTSRSSRSVGASASGSGSNASAGNGACAVCATANPTPHPQRTRPGRTPIAGDDRWMDTITKWSDVLSVLRRERGLLQTKLSALSGINVKTISSFESGARIESMKIWQLARLCEAMGVTLVEFFRVCAGAK